ncbi:MAG: hypothetical protein ACFFCL_08035 [Promethearchaeota archaeon]
MTIIVPTTAIDIKNVKIYQTGVIIENNNPITLPQLIERRKILFLKILSASSVFSEGIIKNNKPKMESITSIEWGQNVGKIPE